MNSSKVLPPIKVTSKRNRYESNQLLAPMTMDAKISNAKMGEVGTGRARIKSGLRKKAATQLSPST